jgi:hypothetical protein
VGHRVCRFRKGAESHEALLLDIKKMELALMSIIGDISGLEDDTKKAEKQILGACVGVCGSVGETA